MLCEDPWGPGAQLSEETEVNCDFIHLREDVSKKKQLLSLWGVGILCQSYRAFPQILAA